MHFLEDLPLRFDRSQTQELKRMLAEEYAYPQAISNLLLESGLPVRAST